MPRRLTPRVTAFVVPALLALACGTPDDPENTTPDGGSGALATTTNVRIITEPSDNAQALVSAIQHAQHSAHMTMYILSSDTVVNALIARKRAGVDVKVLLNRKFPAPGISNGDVFNELHTAGVAVAWAPAAFNFTHEKCVIVDGAEAWIMTMNATGTSPSSNREYLVVDTDADDVAEAEAIFQADWAGTPITPSGKLVVAPVNVRAALLSVVRAAKTDLEVEGEALSDTALVGAIFQAKQRGVAVQVVLSNQDAPPAMVTAVQNLQNGGVSVNMLKKPYVHAKAIVADHALAYVGSANFTANSLDSNRELGVLIGNAAQAKIVADTIGRDFAAGAKY